MGRRVKFITFSQRQICLFVLIMLGIFMPWHMLMNTYSLQQLICSSTVKPSVVKLNRPRVTQRNSNNVLTEEVHDFKGSSSSTPEFQNLEIWRHPKSVNYQTCVDRTLKETENKELATDGFLLAHANGGLNQMKLGISDMVAIAKSMNATLIVPSLDHNSYWNDSSEFQDIFDLTNFIEVLKDDITILESLPSEFASVTPHQMNPVSWSKASYYRSYMKNLLKKHKVVKFLHSDSRLANTIANPLQRLRCRTMYKALKFRKEIEELGLKLIDRLKNNTGDPFIALHLRYEKDMLAFTGCSHGLRKSEHEELTKMRHKVRHWKEKNINGVERRHQGLCPMTPRETALFLEGIGYPSNTKIYVVGGEPFGEDGVRALQEKFPNLYSKTSLATGEELRPFGSFQNRLAAIDYVVSLYSDVFVYTFDGNMARALQGHRKFEGFRRTITPDRKSFVKLVDKLDKGVITKDHFSYMVNSLHQNRTGAPLKRHSSRIHAKSEENFYANPFPGCICQSSPVQE